MEPNENWTHALTSCDFGMVANQIREMLRSTEGEGASKGEQPYYKSEFLEVLYPFLECPSLPTAIALLEVAPTLYPHFETCSPGGDLYEMGGLLGQREGPHKSKDELQAESPVHRTFCNVCGQQTSPQAGSPNCSRPVVPMQNPKEDMPAGAKAMWSRTLVQFGIFICCCFVFIFVASQIWMLNSEGSSRLTEMSLSAALAGFALTRMLRNFTKRELTITETLLFNCLIYICLFVSLSLYVRGGSQPSLVGTQAQNIKSTQATAHPLTLQEIENWGNVLDKPKNAVLQAFGEPASDETTEDGEIILKYSGTPSTNNRKLLVFLHPNGLAWGVGLWTLPDENLEVIGMAKEANEFKFDGGSLHDGNTPYFRAIDQKRGIRLEWHIVESGMRLSTAGISHE